MGEFAPTSISPCALAMAGAMPAARAGTASVFCERQGRFMAGAGLIAVGILAAAEGEPALAAARALLAAWRG